MEIKDLFDKRIFSVSEFNSFVNSVLAPMDVVVEGEVADFRVSQGKFAWFTLRDTTDALSCFALAFKLRQPLEDGMKVRVSGYPKIFGKSGRFSFQVDKMELSGEGTIKRAYEILRKKMETEGLFDAARKRPLPAFPATIGLITSPDAAAYTDFVRQAYLRLGGLLIRLIPVAVQGAGAVDDICKAFDYFNKASDKPDVIVLTRGGGSMEDLQQFNSEEIARAIFASKIPTVCAIGHERDVTLAELAADQRASTPTHAAQIAIPSRDDLAIRVESLTARQKNAVDRRLSSLQQDSAEYINRLTGLAGSSIARIRALSARFLHATRLFDYHRLNLAERLKTDSKLLRSLSPKNILKRGYSIVRKHGKIVKTAASLTPGDPLDIAFSEGSAGTEVTRVNHD